MAATNAKQFKTFCRHLNKWVKRLNLQRWNVNVIHKEPSEELDGNLAWVFYVYESMIAQVGMSKKWDVPFSSRIADMSAFHEAMHLLLAPMLELFEDDSPTKAMAEKEEHLIIAAFERLLFDAKKSDADIGDDQ